MKRAPAIVFLSDDTGLIAHWRQSIGTPATPFFVRFEDFLELQWTVATTVWIDLSLKDLPPWQDAQWHRVLHPTGARIVATSSNPKDDEAMQALDAGCTGYCHAFSDASTLKQVLQVVKIGHVWVGKSLMHRLLQSASKAATKIVANDTEWANGLTGREKEVAVLAANGASNHAIALDCHISERTVKAHLSAVFTKLNITDRLQLALRVHGIA